MYPSISLHCKPFLTYEMSLTSFQKHSIISIHSYYITLIRFVVSVLSFTISIGGPVRNLFIVFTHFIYCYTNVTFSSIELFYSIIIFFFVFTTVYKFFASGFTSLFGIINNVICII